MALEDGAGLRAGTDATVRLIFQRGYRKVDLSDAGTTVTIEAKLNGGSAFSPAPTVTKVSLDGSETAGASGAVDVALDGSDLSAEGELTLEATFSGITLNPNEKVIRIPVRAAHSDAP